LRHGVLGNAQFLLRAQAVLGDALSKKAALAFDVPEAGTRITRRNSGVWPCGVGHGETPDLFLGLAGIGYFCLQIREPTLPSILLLDIRLRV
jgi:lantibiotic modifying enzyme